MLWCPACKNSHEEVAVVVCPKEINQLRAQKDVLAAQIEEITKDFAIHSCPKSGGFCWLCAASDRVEKILLKVR